MPAFVGSRRALRYAGEQLKGIPFTDLFARADGALVGWLYSVGKWAIASNKAVCTPTLGSEILTNPTFEGTYASGVAPNWLFVGSGTPTESADAHGGSKAQQMAGTASADRIQATVTTVANQWYRLTGWGKRTAGTANNVRQVLEQGALFTQGSLLDEAAYTQHTMVAVAPGTTNFRVRPCYQAAAGVGDTVIVDDASFKKITQVDCFAFPGNQFITADPWVKTRITLTDNEQAGIAICVDSNTNPQNGLVAVIRQGGLWLKKLLNGVWSNLIDDVGIGYAANRKLEIIKSGTSVSVYYNGTQVSTTKTVTDTAIINNRWHGLFSTDPGASFSGFLCKSSVVPNGSVMVVLDDANETDYTAAYAYMQPLGLVGSSFIISGLVGTPGNLSVAEMQTMYASGWNFGNHTTSGTDLTTLSEADQEAAIGGCITALNGWGFTTASTILSYPDGNSNADTVTAIAATGIRAAITNSLTYIPAGLTLPTTDTLSIYNHTIDEVKAAMDTAIATNKHNFKLQFHKLVASDPAGAEVLISTFQTLIDYAIAQGYPFITISNLVSAAEWN
jgi:peptidoglycan/xylan/chitin deacetylase (PgdA/CDA1 family)